MRDARRVRGVGYAMLHGATRRNKVDQSKISNTAAGGAVISAYLGSQWKATMVDGLSKVLRITSGHEWMVRGETEATEDSGEWR